MTREHQANKRTALVIEDNDDNMVLICALLQQGGYHTIEATTGQSGLEMALNKKPDLIILDIQLPDMNGAAVLKQLRSAEVNDPIAVIAMTSYAMAGDDERLIEAGCTGYIEKPLEPSRVLDQIESILEKAKEDFDGSSVP